MWQRQHSVLQHETGPRWWNWNWVTALWLNNLPPHPYYQADNRLTHSASVKIYNPDSVPRSKSPLCRQRERGVYSQRRSVFTDWMGWRSVCGWTVREHSDCSRVQYAKRECVKEITLVCFKGAGWTDGMCVFTGSGPGLLLLLLLLNLLNTSLSLLLDKEEVAGKWRKLTTSGKSWREWQTGHKSKWVEVNEGFTLLTFWRSLGVTLVRFLVKKKRESCRTPLGWFPYDCKQMS